MTQTNHEKNATEKITHETETSGPKGASPMDEVSPNDVIGTYHEHNIDIESGTIVLHGSVDQNMQIEFTKNLHYLAPRGYKSVTVLLCSDGGDVNAALAIYDVIRWMRQFVDVNVVAFGVCDSSATIIMQAANKRLLTPNCEFMIHAGDVEVAGPWQETPSQMKQLRTQHSVLEKIYMERINERQKDFSIRRLRTLLKTDTYLLPDKVVELGLADEVLR